MENTGAAFLRNKWHDQDQQAQSLVNEFAGDCELKTPCDQVNRRASKSEGRFNQDDVSGITQRVVVVGVHLAVGHRQHHQVHDQGGRDC